MTDITAPAARPEAGRDAGAVRVPRARLIRTTAFKLTFFYLVAFVVLSLALIAYISSTTADLIERQIENAIAGESAELVSEYRTGGLIGLVETIQRRAMRPQAGVYLITDSSGNAMVGNVSELVYDPGQGEDGATFPLRYSRLNPESQTEATHRALGKLSVLGKRYRLIVGRDVEDKIEFAEIIRRSVRGAIVTVAILAVLSWVFLSRSVLRKVDAVGATTRSIVAGDLSRRLPTDRSGDEFDRLAASVNATLDEVERLHAGLQEVSQNIAHDLKTPLTRVRNRLDQFLRTGVDQDGLAAAIEDCDQLIRTFEALLTIARVESHATAMTLEPTDISALVRDMAEFYEPAAEDVGMRLVAMIDDGVSVRGEPTLLRTMIANLLDNALKYGRADGGEVSLSLRREDGEAVVVVRDRGAGVGAADLPRLTDRFVRADASRSKPGAGLGLSMVKAIVGHHGGRLTLADAAPGLAVRIALPLA